MELYRQLVCFFLNISIIIADINTMTLCSEISPVDFDLFFKIFCQKKKISPFARQPTLTILMVYIKLIVKFSEIKVSIDA